MRRVYLWAAISIFCLSAVFLAGQAGAASSYPTRPVTIIVPFSAGGSGDLSVRILAKEAEKFLGQPIIVVNKAGGGGTLGVSAVTTAKPDGYTLGQSPGGAPFFILPFTEKLPYNPIKDIRYVTQFVELNFAVLVKGDSPFKTFKDLLDYGRANPGKLVYGTNAPNSIANLIIEQVAKKENIQTKHIPFKSSPEYQSAVMGGHIVFSAGDFNVNLVESGQLKALACFSEKRYSAIPDTPTLKELGYDVSCPVFLGIMAPAGTPDDVVKKLEEAFDQAVRQPSFIKGMKELHLTIRHRSSKELTDYVNRNYEAFGKLLKNLGII